MEETNFKRTLITTALPYANGPVHIGHLAGVYVPADIYARYLRLRGQEALLIGGSDEHGVPITLRARKEGCTPQQIVDRYHEMIKTSMEGLGISFDIYSRTTSDIHSRTASDFFRHLYDDGQFIRQTSEQPYDESTGEFLADRYVVGTCPKCGAEGAYGDQCEKCGSSLNATDLIDPRSALTGKPVTMKETTHWYLPLDKWEPRLRQWILQGHKEWKANVYGQCKSWLDDGLQPRAVSRDLGWGVPVPVEGAEGKVLYVWFDAPIGYISNTKELLPRDWEKWWKDPQTRMIHFIGKDNIVFHCIVFPAMLMAHGGYNLPDNVPANEFLNLEGDKISTSRNWAVWLHEYLADFPGKQDTLRYVLTANAPETKDNDFTWADFQTRNNSELVGILGNFVNRAVVLTHKYFDGTVPAAGAETETEERLRRDMAQAVGSLTDALDTFHFREALRQAMEMARLGNRYLQETEPWRLAKTDMARVATILHTALQICGKIAVAFEPFTPFMSRKLTHMLWGEKKLSWDMLDRTEVVASGTRLGEPELLFEKIDDSAIDAQLRKLAEAKRLNAINNWRPEPQAPEVPFEEFERCDLRVGTIVECQKVPKADKLLMFRIDDGTGEPRTIVSGIAKYYKPEELQGRQVLFIANLAPRKLKGVVSCGMLLSAVNPDGSLTLLSPQGHIAPGAKIG